MNPIKMDNVNGNDNIANLFKDKYAELYNRNEGADQRSKQFL